MFSFEAVATGLNLPFKSLEQHNLKVPGTTDTQQWWENTWMNLHLPETLTVEGGLSLSNKNKLRSADLNPAGWDTSDM